MCRVLMPFLSLPSSRTQTDRSRDAGGLWAAKGRSTVCCVSALTGLIRKTLQTATDTAGEGRADAAGDKTRQRPPPLHCFSAVSSFVCSLGQPSQQISVPACDPDRTGCRSVLLNDGLTSWSRRLTSVGELWSVSAMTPHKAFTCKTGAPGAGPLNWQMFSCIMSKPRRTTLFYSITLLSLKQKDWRFTPVFTF